MAKRMSNSERIQRQASEVAAKDKEKAEKKKTVKSTKTTKTTKSTVTKKKTKKKEGTQSKSLKVVWKIFNEQYKEVKTFPYCEKAAADEKAAALTTKSGKKHFVNPVKVPMDD